MVRIVPETRIRSGRDYSAEKNRRRDFQRDGAWFYRHPNGEVSGPFETRAEARAARRSSPHIPVSG